MRLESKCSLLKVAWEIAEGRNAQRDPREHVLQEGMQSAGQPARHLHDADDLVKHSPGNEEQMRHLAQSQCTLGVCDCV